MSGVAKIKVQTSKGKWDLSSFAKITKVDIHPSATKLKQKQGETLP
jgi:hypothetical protein